MLWQHSVWVPTVHNCSLYLLNMHKVFIMHVSSYVIEIVCNVHILKYKPCGWMWCCFERVEPKGWQWFFFSLFLAKTTENIQPQNELERMSWENNQASTKIVTRFYTTNDRMSVDQCPTTKTDTNKLWQLIATIAQLQKPVRNHQGENYPFFSRTRRVKQNLC